MITKIVMEPIKDTSFNTLYCSPSVKLGFSWNDEECNTFWLF